MFSYSDKKALRDLIIQRFDDPSELKPILEKIGKREFMPTNASNLADTISLVVDKANRMGWMPALIEEIALNFEEGLDVVKELNILKTKYKSLANGQNGAADPLKTWKIGGGAPYVNRAEVEHAFRSLSERGTGFRVVIINGPRQSGKSYLADYARYIADVSGDAILKLAYVDLSEGYYANTRLQVLKKILSLWNKAPESPIQYAQSSSAASDLAYWLCSQAPNDHSRETVPYTWIIIDGLAKVPPDQSLLDFIFVLRSEILTNSDMQIRIVLLDTENRDTGNGEVGNSTPLLWKRGNSLLEKRLEIQPIGELELTVFLRQVYETKRIFSQDDKILECVKTIMPDTSKVSEEGEIKKLHHILQSFIDTLGGE